nr:uncharacterized protein K02A2.6-like [Dermacentor andersoni]
MAHQAPHFADAKDKWSSYYTRVESYFEGNDIVDDAKRRALLISALSSKPIDALSGRCAPRKALNNERAAVLSVCSIKEQGLNLQAILYEYEEVITPEGGVHSTLNLRDAYNQVPLDEQSKELTVITTHRGLLCFNRLPFGVSSAPAVFQRIMDSVLNGLPGVQAYFDDVLVAEKGNNGRKNLKAVLLRFREYAVKLRKDKCTFRMPEVSYHGCKISTGGLQPLDKNMDAVIRAPTPKNVSELRSYLGLLTYFSKFLLNMTSLLSPLYDLLTKERR